MVAIRLVKTGGSSRAEKRRCTARRQPAQGLFTGLSTGLDPTHPVLCGRLINMLPTAFPHHVNGF